MASRTSLLGHLERIGGKIPVQQVNGLIHHFSTTSSASPTPPKKKVLVAKTEYKLNTEDVGAPYPYVPPRQLSLEEISSKDEAFVNSLNEFLRENRVPIKPVNTSLPPEHVIQANREYLARKTTMETSMRLKYEKYGNEGITKDDIRAYLRLVSKAPVDRSMLQVEMSPDVFKKITTVVETEVDMTEEEIETWRREQEIAAYRQKLREEAAAAAAKVPEGTPLGPSLPPRPEPVEPANTNTTAATSSSAVPVQTENPYAATPRAILRPRRSRMPPEVKARLEWLINQAETRGLGDPEKRERLLYVSSLPTAEKLEALKSLAILQEITSISMDWNRSSAAAIPTASAPDAAAPTTEWRPSSSLAPGSSDDKGRQLSSFFTTDVSLSGRDYAFENVQVLPNLPSDAHLVEQKPADAENATEDANATTAAPSEAKSPEAAEREAAAELQAIVEAIETMPEPAALKARTTTPTDQYDDFHQAVPVDVDPAVENSAETGSNAKITAVGSGSVDPAVVERAKRLFAKDSIYVQNVLNGKESASPEGVMLDPNLPSVAERAQANKSALEMLMRRKPRGKLHAGEIRELMVAHSSEPHINHVDALCERYDISLLTVLEELKRRVSNDIITDMGVGGFTPPVFKLKRTAPIIDEEGRTIPGFLEFAQTLSPHQDPEFMKRLTTPDEYGYITMLASDVLIPNVPEHILRPVLLKAYTKESSEEGDNTAQTSIYSHSPGKDHGRGVGAVRPEENMMSEEDIQVQRENMVDSIVLLRGKSMQQLHALGLFNVDPYDGAIDEDDGGSNIRGRYAFTDNVINAFSNPLIHDLGNDDIAKIMFGKNYTQRRAKKKSEPAPVVTMDDADDYGVADNTFAINTEEMEKEAEQGPVRRVAATTQTQPEQNVTIDDENQQEMVSKVRSVPIDDFALLASVSAVLVKYQHHPRGGLDHSGLNLVDETIKVMLRDGKLGERTQEEIEELKERAQKFPILALEAMLENTTVPYMYRVKEHVPGMQTNIVGVFKRGQTPGKAIGYFHPDIFYAVHNMATGKGASLAAIDADAAGNAIDRESVMLGLDEANDELKSTLINVNTGGAASDTSNEYASVAMRYAQANAALGVGMAASGPVEGVDYSKHSMNTGHKLQKPGQTEIDTSSTHTSIREEEKRQEEIARTFDDAGSGLGKVHVVSSLDEIQEIDDANAFNAFVMEVDVDEAKAEHMLQYYYKSQENQVDLTRGVKIAGVLQDDATVSLKLKGRNDDAAVSKSEEQHVVETAEHVMGMRDVQASRAEQDLLNELVHDSANAQQVKANAGKTTVDPNINSRTSLQEYVREQKKLKEQEERAKGIVDAEVVDGAKKEGAEKEDVFKGQKKELFGGPLAVKAYLESLVKKQQKKDKM